MAGDVWAWCQKAGAFGRTVSVKVKFADFRQITRSCSYPAALAGHQQLQRVSLDLIGSVLPLAKGVMLIDVTVSNFEAERMEASPLPLFGSGPGPLSAAALP
jgi:DNA polymerase-4